MFPRFPHAILDASLLFLVGLYQGLFFAHLLKVLSFLQPLLQQGPQLTHVLEAELQDLKAGDGHLSKENIQGEPHVSLGACQGDPLLLRGLGKLF